MALVVVRKRDCLSYYNALNNLVYKRVLISNLVRRPVEVTEASSLVPTVETILES